MAATFTPTWGESNLMHVVNGAWLPVSQRIAVACAPACVRAPAVTCWHADVEAAPLRCAPALSRPSPMQAVRPHPRPARPDTNINIPSPPAGYLYCNLPGLEAPLGSTVRFVLVGMGSEADLHSPVFAGQVRAGVVVGGWRASPGLGLSHWGALPMPPCSFSPHSLPFCSLAA